MFKNVSKILTIFFKVDEIDFRALREHCKDPILTNKMS